MLKTVTVYPARYTDDDLQAMRLLAGRLAMTAPIYSSWLTGIVTAEIDRRDRGEDAEGTLSAIPVQDWSDGDLLDALLAGHCMSLSAGNLLSSHAADSLGNTQQMTIAEVRRRWRGVTPSRDNARADRLARIAAEEAALDRLIGATLNAGPAGWARHPEIDAVAQWARSEAQIESDPEARQALNWISTLADFKSHQMQVALRDHEHSTKENTQ